MKIIRDVRKAPPYFERLVLTIGCFDGVHLGHQAIIQAVIEEAKRIHGIPGVMTLEPNPRLYFSPAHAPNLLTDLPTRCKLLQSLGVEVLFILPFDKATATMTAKEFVDVIIVERCRAQIIVVGHDFSFGQSAAGSYEFLAALAPRYGFHVRQVPPLIIGGQRVSSTLIRERVLQGEVEDMDIYLGRKFSLCGKVVPGSGIGKVLGFPTANVDVGTCIVPAHGVYAAEAILDETRWKAAVNIGIAPTIRAATPLIEAHLLDFEGNLVNRSMELIFYRRLRPEKKFASREELITAIRHDVETVRKFPFPDYSA